MAWPEDKKDWDGADRRANTQKDHDLLIEIHSLMKHVVEWQKDHEIRDNQRFDKMDKSIEIGKRILYGGMGIFIFIEFISKLLK